MRFCAKLGKRASETLDILRVAYGDNAFKNKIVFVWHERFKEGWESVKDDERPGQPKNQQSCQNVERVRQLVRSARQLSVQIMAEELNLNRETRRKILVDYLGTRNISAKMVSRLLSNK
jgi:hypothetical protein